MTCRCRFCGYVISYSSDDVGLDARCPRCAGTVRLPGRLTTVATVGARRQTDRLGVTLEALGFLCMFFFFPWGLLAGVILLFFGWRRSTLYYCTACGAKLPRKSMESCPSCRAKFSRE